jgi:hypothetical protein
MIFETKTQGDDMRSKILALRGSWLAAEIAAIAGLNASALHRPPRARRILAPGTRHHSAKAFAIMLYLQSGESAGRGVDCSQRANFVPLRQQDC